MALGSLIVSLHQLKDNNNDSHEKTVFSIAVCLAVYGLSTE